MSRTIVAAIRAQLEASHGSDDLLAFLTIAQAQLSSTIYVVNDIATQDGFPVTYSYNGNLYVATPFSIQMLTDTDDAPHARLEIANINRIIGQAVQAATSLISVTLTMIPTSAFDLTKNPRTAISTPVVPVLTALGLHLANVEVDALMVVGELFSLDDTQEPWPSTRAIASVLPGLFIS